MRCKVREGDSGGSGYPEGEKQYDGLLCVLWYTHREICCRCGSNWKARSAAVQQKMIKDKKNN